jgi:hypothetical protein
MLSLGLGKHFLTVGPRNKHVHDGQTPWATMGLHQATACLVQMVPYRHLGVGSGLGGSSLTWQTEKSHKWCNFQSVCSQLNLEQDAT